MHRSLSVSLTAVALALFAGASALAQQAAPPVAPEGAKPPEAANPQTSPQAAQPVLGIRCESVDGGVTVRKVRPDSPAAKAGLQEGDLIQKIDNQPVANFLELIRIVRQHKPGDQIAVHFRRGDQEQDAKVKLGSALPTVGEAPRGRAPGFLGVATRELSQEARNRLGISAQGGAVVVDVMPGTPAAKAGLKNDDVIMKVNDKPINNPADLRNAVMQAGAGQDITLKVQRGEKSQDMKAHLEGPREGGFVPQER